MGKCALCATRVKLNVLPLPISLSTQKRVLAEKHIRSEFVLFAIVHGRREIPWAD